MAVKKANQRQTVGNSGKASDAHAKIGYSGGAPGTTSKGTAKPKFAVGLGKSRKGR